MSKFLKFVKKQIPNTNYIDPTKLNTQYMSRFAYTAHRARFLSNLVPALNLVNNTYSIIVQYFTVFQQHFKSSYFAIFFLTKNYKYRKDGDNTHEKAPHKMLMTCTTSADQSNLEKRRCKINEYLIYKSKHLKVKNCNIFDITTTFKPELSKHILQQ